jgi:DNA-binding NarL/FixJ family response regulator
MGTDVIRVAVIEDHPLFRQGLVQVIAKADGLDLVASVQSVGEMEEIGFAGVDVVILDLHLPDCEGAVAVSRVKAQNDAILVISASDDRKHVVDAIAAGACGYLTKSSDADEITKAIVTIASGSTYVSPVLAAYLLRDTRDQGRSSSFALTAREREILSLLADGETDADIADRLFISVRTVRSHLDRIRDKTGHRRRAELARLAFEDDQDSGSK